MTSLVGRSFGQTFTFARPVAAPYRNAGGGIVSAPVNVARFDHDEAGARIGLLIGTGESEGEHDRLSVIAGDWEVSGPATVMVEWAEGDLTRRRGLYSTNVRATVNACLDFAGHYRFLIVVAGYLPNLGSETVPGYVRYRNVSYPLGNALSAGNGAAIGAAGNPVIVSS